MTADELRKAGTRYRQTRDRANQARHERDQLIRQALTDGYLLDDTGRIIPATHSRLAKLAGMDRSRVGQIAMTLGRERR